MRKRNVIACIAGGCLIAAAFAQPVEASGASSVEARSVVAENVIVLTESNVVRLDGPFTFETIGTLSADILTQHSKLAEGEPLYVVLNSPGGYVQAGLELLHVVEGLKALGRPIHTLTIQAYSMGFITVQGLGDRLLLKYGTLMSHQVSGGIRGDVRRIDSKLGNLQDVIRQIDEMVVGRTQGLQTLESYVDAYRDEMWCTGQTCVELGYADRVVSAVCDSSLQGTEVVEATAQSLFGSSTIELERHRCPLITGGKALEKKAEAPSPEEDVEKNAYEGLEHIYYAEPL